MKCPKCGADSSVLATRAFRTVMLKRSRRCFNEHRFESVELPVGALWHQKLAAIENGVAIRAKAQKLKHAVLSSPDQSNVALADRLGCTEARVRQIRQEVIGAGKPVAA